MPRRYFWNLLLSLDEMANAFAGGDPRETISSRASKARMKGRKWAYLLCRILNVFQIHHCVQSQDDAVGNKAVIPD